MADIRIFVVSLGYGQVSMGTPHGATSDLVKSDLLYGQNSTTRRFCTVAIFTTTAIAYQILPYLAFIILFFSSYVKFGGPMGAVTLPRPRPTRRAYKLNNVHNADQSPTNRRPTGWHLPPQFQRVRAKINHSPFISQYIVLVN